MVLCLVTLTDLQMRRARLSASAELLVDNSQIFVERVRQVAPRAVGVAFNVSSCWPHCV